MVHRGKYKWLLATRNQIQQRKISSRQGQTFSNEVTQSRGSRSHRDGQAAER